MKAKAETEAAAAAALGEQEKVGSRLFSCSELTTHSATQVEVVFSTQYTNAGMLLAG